MANSLVFLDFETRSECDIKACGVSVYAQHPTTASLCLAYKIDDGPVSLWVGGPLPGDLLHAIATGAEFHAHNAAFEKAIWKYVMVAQHNWPEIAESRWHCTAARAAAVALPRDLDGAGKALGLAIQKDPRGKRLIQRLCKPRKPTKKDPSEWNNNPAELNELYEYCKQDVLAEVAIHNATPDLHPRERLTWLLDQRINERGIPVDRAKIVSALGIEAKQETKLLAELRHLTGGEVETARQVERLLNWLNRNGLNIHDTRASTIAACLDDNYGGPHSPIVQRVLEIRRELAKASTAKLSTMIVMADADDRIRGSHLYHGASTGRWAGRGVQFQNIVKSSIDKNETDDAIESLSAESPELLEMLFGSVSKTLSSLIRPMVKAEAGKRLIVCDFAGIEARVLAWLAGERQLVENFRSGIDVYVDMAGRITAATGMQASRQLGKVAILGLGYSMGAGKFVATAAGYGIELTEDFAQKVVDTYRTTYKKIRNYWYALNDAAIAAVNGKPTSVGRVRYYVDDRWLFCKLPCGRSLAYCDPQVRDEETPWGKKPQLSYMTVDSKTKKWTRQRTYGGMLCENIVQATARDFLVEALFRLEKAGYPTIMHVHDETVSEVPIGFGSVHEVESILATVPSWGEGCPLAAEGFESERYRK